MALRIETDHGRFRRIVRGKIREELRRFMTRGEMIGRRGRDVVSIPLPQIDIPHFQHAPRGQTGVAQGDGEPGQVLGPAGEGEGGGRAGNAPGQHILEAEITLEELAAILGEELELPRIQPKGHEVQRTTRGRFKGIATAGPESLRHFRRTYRQALRRQIIAGSYDPRNPRVVPIREDLRYRAYEPSEEPKAAAAILYVMDVSGSMGDEQKEIVRIEAFWIDTWLQSQYRGITTAYVIHDAEAREVDRDTFFRTRESGGTVISSAYNLCRQIISDRFPEEKWNVYLFHFSDGDNWSSGDTEECVRLLRGELLPSLNLFGYGQVESPYGTGQFLGDLQEAFGDDECVALSPIEGRDAIPRSIRDFLGRGR
jgi:uncharacterized sporulation protein YeaH/YhbH (DUF444 family)